MTTYTDPTYLVTALKMLPNEEFRHSNQRISLRDYFAGQALLNPYTANESYPAKIAEWAYQIADAMIAAKDTK